MKVVKSLVGMSLVAFLSACGGGSTTPTPTPVNIFNGIVVPPDPGATATASVAGVDTNQNGIRDEVDRYIAQKYGADATQFDAAQKLAMANQLLLITSISDVNAATAAVFANADAGVCHAIKFNNNRIVGTRINKDLVLQTFNTIDRQKQFQAIVSKVSQFTRSTDGVICK